MSRAASALPLRLLIVCPSWVGDAAMATPALRLLRDRLPGAFIGALVRPGIDQVLDGAGLVDEFHVARRSGILGPKHVGARIRPRAYDTALLLTNSFSTALITRVAGIERRMGYDRDGRGLLLTDRLTPPKRPDGRWAIVPAVEYYLSLARALLGDPPGEGEGEGAERPEPPPLELAVTPEDERRLARAGEEAGAELATPLAVLVPGASKPEKRWPPERFAALADHLARAHGMNIVICGGPDEAPIVDEVADRAEAPVGRLAGGSFSIGALKALIARAALVVTNDTGPRHLAAALGIPSVALFGPTDHRWTLVPARPGGPQRIVLADPTLPESDSANDHPERCRIDRIDLERAREAVESALAEVGCAGPSGPGSPPGGA